MKIKVLLAIFILAIGLTGCTSKEEKDLVEEGRVALEKHEYTQATELLADALQIDSADEYARAMYMQATRMASASEYEKEENYKKAIIDLEFIENIKGGSSVIKSEASNKKKELVKLQEEYEAAQSERKQNAKVTSANDTYRIEQQALAEYEKQLEEEKQKEEEQNKEEQENSQNQNNGVIQPEGGTTLIPQVPSQSTPEQIVQ